MAITACILPDMEPDLRFGIVLPTYIPAEHRLVWAEQSFASLAKSVTEGLDAPPALLFIVRPSPEPYDAEAVIKRYNFPQFSCAILSQPADAGSVDACLIYGYDFLLRHVPGITHLFMLASDWLYNTRWLLELRDLILRHPEAKSCWVYRSAYEQFHKTLRLEGPDVLVRSMNAGGCFPVQDYLVWHPDYRDFLLTYPLVDTAMLDEATGVMTIRLQDGQWFVLPQGTEKPLALLPVKHGLTMDLYDPWLRPGERWVTARSYIFNLGVEGMNQRSFMPEHAIDFVGEDAV